jgi:hypothetical protein
VVCARMTFRRLSPDRHKRELSGGKWQPAHAPANRSVTVLSRRS